MVTKKMMGLMGLMGLMMMTMLMNDDDHSDDN